MELLSSSQYSHFNIVSSGSVTVQESSYPTSISHNADELLGFLSEHKSLAMHTLRSFSEKTVLGLARTGLIFTGLQEGAQPGGGG